MPSDRRNDSVPSRREFIRSGLCAAAAGVLGSPAALRAEPAKVVSNRAVSISPDPNAIARVIHTRSQYASTGQRIEPTIVRSFFEEGLRALTGAAHSRDAWNQILRPEDAVLVKCNGSGAEQLACTEPVVDALLHSLVLAGFSLEQITVLEAGSSGLVRKTRKADLRWQQTPVHFGSAGSDTFLAALDQATAIINVPFIKTHHLATMSGCLKNLSHGLIRHPARFHGGGCDPAIGQIVASASIRSKLRLNVVNGLRVVFNRGPDARPSDVHSAGSMLFSTDPVAADAVGYGLLTEVRATRELPPLLPSASLPRQLVTAHTLGLGQPDGERIQTLEIEL